MKIRSRLASVILSLALSFLFYWTPCVAQQTSVDTVDQLNRQDETETPRNVELTNAAWDAFRHHRYADAISAADRCVQRFKEEADQGQADLEERKSKQPPVGKVDDNQKRAIFDQGVLNDVATCYWIKARSEERLHRKDEAREDYRATITYSYARTWDPKANLFWSPAQAASDHLSTENYFTVAANIVGGGYRRTQFFEPNYDTWVGDWDSRIEFWPSGRDKFAWGPYVRVAAIIGTKRDAWQNGALAAPGAGLQMYPFSFKGRLKFLDPLRIFGEYNFMHYWADNPGGWRPKSQLRAGFEYWKAVNVNNTTEPWWLETYDAALFQSANEFAQELSYPIVANTLRFGFRWPGKSPVSYLTPYAALESSWDKYERSGRCFLSNPDSRNPNNPCDFFWENRFVAGGGMRITPPLGDQKWLTRLVIYGEYLKVPNYYGPEPPPATPSIPATPRFDIRIGLSASFANWYPSHRPQGE